MEDRTYYVLFNNHEDGLKLHKILRQKGLKAQISPTPRSLSHCCGISLIVDNDELDEVREAISESGIDVLGLESVKTDINPNRDRYC